MTWANPGFERERRRALDIGLLVSTSESPKGTHLYVFAPPEEQAGAIKLVGVKTMAVIHRSTKPGYRTWQVSFFRKGLPAEDRNFERVQQALDFARGLGLLVDEVENR